MIPDYETNRVCVADNCAHHRQPTDPRGVGHCRHVVKRRLLGAWALSDDQREMWYVPNPEIEGNTL